MKQVLNNFMEMRDINNRRNRHKESFGNLDDKSLLGFHDTYLSDQMMISVCGVSTPVKYLNIFQHFPAMLSIF